ncbi:hypothetical protein DFH27DRAFT_29509 [Peziza echinospora]|nr:hypothetical protein DFH27DRAFT_29509 [Peziza echinospora]
MSATTDDLIDGIIKNGKVDLEAWPSLLKVFLERLDYISANSFPATVTQPGSGAQLPSTSAGSSNTENNSSANASNVAENQTEGSPAEPMDTATESTLPQLPTPPPPTEPQQATPSPEALAMISEIKETLSTTFAAAPPHTVQRLAELLQNPTQHYRFLIKFLRAVQRVVSVSSTVNQFPLPSSVDPPSGGIPNILGSDESLGGALLTPISWLKDSGVGEFETGMNGVSQGELLRQEQEHGIVSHPTNGENGDERVHVHAQGPSTLGPEDLGPQPPGVVFPDLGSPPPENATLQEAEAQAKQNQSMDDLLMSMEDEQDAEQNPLEQGSNTEDKMDVDDKATEEKQEDAVDSLPTEVLEN